MTFDLQLLPFKEEVTVECLDAKGIKVFRTQVETDEYGMVPVDLPLDRRCLPKQVW